MGAMGLEAWRLASAYAMDVRQLRGQQTSAAWVLCAGAQRCSCRPVAVWPNRDPDRCRLLPRQVCDCAVKRESGSSWSRILAYRVAAAQPRDERFPMVRVVLEAVRPDPLLRPALLEHRHATSCE